MEWMKYWLIKWVIDGLILILKLIDREKKKFLFFNEVVKVVS